MKLAPEIENALVSFTPENDIMRKEALTFIARLWLIGHGYLPADETEDKEG